MSRWRLVEGPGKNSRSRDTLSALESRVVHLKESLGEVKQTLEVVETMTDELDPMKEQFKEYVVEALSSNMDTVEALLNTVMGKLTEKTMLLKLG